MLKQQTSVQFNQTLGSVWLDSLRGVAASLVLLHHWRYMFFRELHEIPAHRGLYAIPYALSATVHEAVILFFVLSGFLVGSSALRSFDERHWEWRRYLTHRLTRLWVVLLPALLLTFLWDTVHPYLATRFVG